MLREADARTRADGARSRMRFARASALDLPFRDGAFDLAMSAFVVRNLPRLPDAFRELRRTLAPGGTLLTLEITEPTSPWVRSGFHTYFDTMVPFLGELAGSQGPYRYLPESLKHLPDRAGMLTMLRQSGFGEVEAVPQSLGIVTAYLAHVPGGA
jgi:demethylmenaquinone methyltransferase/2-methoxy-6-polyprenyl-1,4-benzoquinol methylase